MLKKSLTQATKKPMSSNRLELSHGKSSGGLAFTQS